MKTIFASTYTDLADFEQFAQRARQSDATHVGISPNLPWSYWEYDQPGDPYPAWVIPKPSLLKIATPDALRSYVPADYSEKVLAILQGRCAVLRRLGLKATYATQEPSMLPEAVFTDHPLWRGARVDHPARSRVARFAPTIDHPEVLALYRQAMAILLQRCPEIDTVNITTNDSGAGLDWSPGTYSGRMGNTLYRERRMDERIRGFFDVLRQAAADAGGSLEISIYLTREPDPARLAAKLDRGMAIENREGPDATPYQASAGVGESYTNPFYPVYGIPQPLQLLEGLVRIAPGSGDAPGSGGASGGASGGGGTSGGRRSINFADRLNRDLYFEIYDRFHQTRLDDPAMELAFLKEIAATRVGADKAGDLLRLWIAIHESSRLIKQLLYAGGSIFNLGCVQQRWLTRPFIPFPEELTTEQKAYYRRFQFQALGEEDANSLANVQAATHYLGWSGRHFVRRTLEPVEAQIDRAAELATKLGDPTLARRLAVFNCIVRNARNAVSYQAQLDRVKQLGIKPLPYAVSGSLPEWDRQLMMETARAELDNTAILMDLLRRDPGTDPAIWLDLAPTKEEEDIRLLGPDILDQLQKKLNLMNAKWEDYKRVFTTPNW